MNLSDPDEWILKMVQAAVAGGCRKLAFKLGRLTTQVEFTGQDFCLQSIKEALLDPNSSQDAFYAELLIGLRSLLFRSEFRIKSSGGAWFALKDAVLHESEEADDPSDQLTLVVANKLGPIDSLRQRTNYLDLLKKRALFSSVPIKVDNRPLMPKEILAATTPEFTTDHPRFTAPLLFAKFRLGETLKEDDLTKAPGAPFTDPLRSLEYYLSRKNVPFRSPLQGHLHLEIDYRHVQTERMRQLRTVKEQQFLVKYTRLGVVANTKTYSDTLGGCLHIPADELRSDLSGLSVKDDPDISLQFLSPYFLKLKEVLSDERSRPHNYPVEWGRVAAGFAMAGGMVMLSALSAGLGLLTVAKATAVAGGIGGGSQLSMERHTKVLREDILASLEDLRGKLGV